MFTPEELDQATLTHDLAGYLRRASFRQCLRGGSVPPLRPIMHCLRI